MNACMASTGLPVVMRVPDIIEAVVPACLHSAPRQPNAASVPHSTAPAPAQCGICASLDLTQHLCPPSDPTWCLRPA